MKHIKFIIISAICTLAGLNISCNYLNVDDYFDDTLSLDSVFHNKANMERYMWGIANDFPDEGQIMRKPYTPGPLASDEMCAANPLSTFNGGTRFILGEVTADNMGSGESIENLSTWGGYYQIIRRTNTLLSRMDEASDMEPSDKIFFLGYTHFLRAYAYYNLLMNYGPVVLMGDEVMNNNE